MYAHARANFPGGIYPDPDQDDMYTGYSSIPALVDLPQERRDRVVFYAGHLPCVASQLMGMDLVTLALVRDPVERTISFLKQNKLLTPRHQDLSLDEIYEDEFFHPALVLDHQTEVFSMRPDDELQNIYEFIDMDADRLALAKENLSRVGVVGLSERFDDFLEVLRTRYRWEIGPAKRFRESTDPWEASPSLRRRIAEENAIDMEFYEFARELCRDGVHSS